MSLPSLGPPWQIGMIRVSRNEWIASAVVAGLRMASNEERDAHRSRGDDKNVLNDIQGAIGELIAIKALEERHGSNRVRHEILDWAGGTGRVQDAVDLLVEIPGYGTLRFESKCHLDTERKALLLINRTAHERSRRRQALGYIPIVGVLGREQACIGHLIEHAELDHWPARDFKYKDTALGRPLKDVSMELFGFSWTRLREAMRASPEAASEETLRRVARGAAHRFNELRAAGLELSGLSHRQLVAAARSEAKACWEAAQCAATSSERSEEAGV